MKKKKQEVQGMISVGTITQSILLLRGQKIILDSVLADLYGVDTKVLIQAVKRNLNRFPADFMFQLTVEEAERLRSQIVTLKNGQGEMLTADEAEYLRSQFVTSNQRGGRRYLPYAFTEQGVAMLSSVLRSDRAVGVNIEIMRAFVRLRQMLESHKNLARKLENLEKKYDTQFKVIFDAIRQLMEPPAGKKKRSIGFAPWKNE
ncbi:MAG: ORF6N domain-containing protein [Gammaproteobacteria bacterium]